MPSTGSDIRIIYDTQKTAGARLDGIVNAIRNVRRDLADLVEIVDEATISNNQSNLTPMIEMFGLADTTVDANSDAAALKYMLELVKGDVDTMWSHGLARVSKFAG